ncbi:MAG: DDE-type integrase/transposase/recombinase [Alphaproteobacteria bacterium]|nr:DDE-type integrase/transposase/recombinase [Alphaproteobacteria bacterium]
MPHFAANQNFPKHPGRQVQIGVKLVPFKATDRRFLCRYQFTAIDIATRLRFLWIYPNLNPANAAKFLKKANSFFSALGIVVQCTCTDNLFIFRGNNFSGQCRKLGIAHCKNRCGSFWQNHIIENCHRMDDEEFYRHAHLERLTDKALMAKLQIWQYRYNCMRPQTACKGETPFACYLHLAESE